MLLTIICSYRTFHIIGIIVITKGMSLLSLYVLLVIYVAFPYSIVPTKRIASFLQPLNTRLDHILISCPADNSSRYKSDHIGRVLPSFRFSLVNLVTGCCPRLKSSKWVNLNLNGLGQTRSFCHYCFPYLLQSPLPSRISPTPLNRPSTVFSRKCHHCHHEQQTRKQLLNVQAN